MPYLACRMVQSQSSWNKACVISHMYILSIILFIQGHLKPIPTWFDSQFHCIICRLVLLDLQMCPWFIWSVIPWCSVDTTLSCGWLKESFQYTIMLFLLCWCKSSDKVLNLKYTVFIWYCKMSLLTRGKFTHLITKFS